MHPGCDILPCQDRAWFCKRTKKGFLMRNVVTTLATLVFAGSAASQSAQTNDAALLNSAKLEVVVLKPGDKASENKSLAKVGMRPVTYQGSRYKEVRTTITATRTRPCAYAESPETGAMCTEFFLETYLIR